jgi:hypothetical protein
MRHYIEAENKLSSMFVQRVTNWEPFTEKWLQYTFGEHNITLDKDKYHDLEVALIPTHVR